MNLISVDQERCVKCGRCAIVCPRGLIRLDREWPQATAEELCLACGQCVAVCPTSALNNAKTPLASQVPLKNISRLDPDTARQFLRSRRSIRCYNKSPINRTTLLQWLDIARFAPSGSNSQGLSYRILEKAETLSAITEQTVVWLENQATTGHPAAKSYAAYAAIYRQTGQDVILRGAPCLVLGMAQKDFPRGRENTHFALAYAELFAPSLGLGTCWAGLFEAAAMAEFEPVLSLLGLPEDKTLTGAIMAGYPKFGFHRLTDRNPLDLVFDSAGIE